MSTERSAVAQNCWSTAGRPGPGTCPQLAEHLLCRNCPTYAAAALRLLDRPAPADYTRQWTAHLAHAPVKQGTATASLLIFRLGAEWLGIAASAVQQVTEPSTVHVLPHRQLPVRGLVSVRGELIICVALEVLLGIDRTAGAGQPRESSRLVVLADAGGKIAFQPDAVDGVWRHDPDAILAPPATLARSAHSHFTLGLLSSPDRVIGVLDPIRVAAGLARSFS